MIESTLVYDVIHENGYDDLKPKQEKRYENQEVVDKIYVSLKPIVMEAIKGHMQSTVIHSWIKMWLYFKNLAILCRFGL